MDLKDMFKQWFSQASPEERASITTPEPTPAEATPTPEPDAAVEAEPTPAPVAAQPTPAQPAPETRVVVVPNTVVTQPGAIAPATFTTQAVEQMSGEQLLQNWDKIKHLITD